MGISQDAVEENLDLSIVPVGTVGTDEGLVGRSRIEGPGMEIGPRVRTGIGLPPALRRTGRLPCLDVPRGLFWSVVKKRIPIGKPAEPGDEHSVLENRAEPTHPGERGS
jgi:hypothetical protein